MIYNAKGGHVRIGDTDMDYISFGKGSRVLVMLPGLGDGITTVRYLAVPMAVQYRMYAERYRVYVFCRKNHLEEGCSTREMTRDQAEAMRLLGIERADVLGISQGGMIAQYLAADFPEMVGGLVLAVTTAGDNRQLRRVVGHWMKLAKRGDYRRLMIDTAERMYTEAYLKKYRLLYPLLTRIGKPKDFDRFLIQAAACISHNADQALEKIVCPTLVIGGGCDQVVGKDAAKELAKRVKTSRLYVYQGLGHAAYEEAEDFHARVMRFLERSASGDFYRKSR